MTYEYGLLINKECLGISLSTNQFSIAKTELTLETFPIVEEHDYALEAKKLLKGANFDLLLTTYEENCEPGALVLFFNVQADRPVAITVAVHFSLTNILLVHEVLKNHLAKLFLRMSKKDVSSILTHLKTRENSFRVYVGDWEIRTL